MAIRLAEHYRSNQALPADTRDRRTNCSCIKHRVAQQASRNFGRTHSSRTDAGRTRADSARPLGPRSAELSFALLEKRSHCLKLIGLVDDPCLLDRLSHEQVCICRISHHIGDPLCASNGIWVLACNDLSKLHCARKRILVHLSCEPIALCLLA